VLESLLPPLCSLIRVLGGEVLGAVAKAGTAPTMTIVKITRPIDRRTSAARFARKSRIGDSAAAVKSRGGRKTSRMRSGSSLMRDRPGTNARPRPPSTRSVG
jgi:hypothetical protein